MAPTASRWPSARLAGAHGADRLAMALLAAQLDDRPESFDRAGEEIERGLVL